MAGVMSGRKIYVRHQRKVQQQQLEQEVFGMFAMAEPPAVVSVRGFAEALAAPLPSEQEQEWPNGEQTPRARELREACRYDIELFAREFFPELCRAPFNAMHRQFFADANREAREGITGVRQVDVAPRGSGKTSVRLRIKPIHRAVYGISRYYLICSAEYRLAQDKVKDIRDIFEQNGKLRDVYGPQETKEWKQGDFVIAQGCRFRAFTPRSATRGLLWGAYRPSDIILDDAEDRETVLTKLRRDRFSRWFFEDVTKLGDAQTNIELIGTLLHPESFLAEMLEKAGWNGRKYQSVLSWADSAEAITLWQQWRDIVVDLDADEPLANAEAFFQEHREAMMAGAEVLWPEWRPYEQLMLTRLTESEHAFWQEDQNEPQLDASYLFQEEGVARCRVLPDGILRQDGRMVSWREMTGMIAYYDSTPGDNPGDPHRDWAACPIVAQDQQGYQYLVDLYTARVDSSDEQMEGVVDICWKWQVQKLGIESIGHQATLVDTLRQKFLGRAQGEGHQWAPMLVPVKDTRNKLLRIRTLEPRFVNKWLHVSETIHQRFWQELRGFTVLTKDNADDCLDAISGAVHMLVTGEV